MANAKVRHQVKAKDISCCSTNRNPRISICYVAVVFTWYEFLFYFICFISFIGFCFNVNVVEISKLRIKTIQFHFSYQKFSTENVTKWTFLLINFFFFFESSVFITTWTFVLLKCHRKREKSISLQKRDLTFSWVFIQMYFAGDERCLLEKNQFRNFIIFMLRKTIFSTDFNEIP